MNTTRFLQTSILLLVAATAACTDAPAPPPPSAPIARAPLPAEAARAGQSERVDAPRWTGGATGSSRRELPSAYRWVGEEHNRLLGLIHRDLGEARRRGLVPKGDPSRECRWMWSRVKREAQETARRGGFAGHEREVTEAAEPAVLDMPLCRGTGSSGLPAAPAFPASAPLGAGRVEISEAAFRVIETVRGRIVVSSSMEDLDAAIADAASAASSLSTADAAAVHAALSVARHSAEYWAGAMARPQRWSLFRSDWEDLTGFVGADVGGCGATLSFLRMFSAALPLNFKIGVCALSAAVSSGMQYAGKVYAQ